jgi:hypothetical protein
MVAAASARRKAVPSHSLVTDRPSGRAIPIPSAFFGVTIQAVQHCRVRGRRSTIPDGQ